MSDGRESGVTPAWAIRPALSGPVSLRRAAELRAEWQRLCGDWLVRPKTTLQQIGEWQEIFEPDQRG